MYSEFSKDDMILRDHLAQERTALANERTWLSYLRTSIGLLATGGSMIKFFPENIIVQISGWLLMGCAAFCAIWGWRRFLAVKKKLKYIDLSE